MKVDFTIDELEHIRNTVTNTVRHTPKDVNTIQNKIDGILDTVRYNKPNVNTQLGSSRKPVT